MTETNNQEKKEEKKEVKNVLTEIGDSMERLANRTLESVKKTLDRAMDSRNTVLTIRVNDDANQKLSQLVEAGLFKSRSESAAFLIEEGIKHQLELFTKIEKKMSHIEKLKEELKTIVANEIKITKPEPEKKSGKTKTTDSENKPE
jgi:predicted transcriptional regulator